MRLNSILAHEWWELMLLFDYLNPFQLSLMIENLPTIEFRFFFDQPEK